MNGVHDLGGMHGFGPVEREVDEPVFHAPWERALWGLNRAVIDGGAYNLDEFRHGIERMAPARYLASGYYERWLDGISRLLAEKGIVTETELEARAAAYRADRGAPAGAAPVARPAAPSPADTAGQHRFRRQATAPPRFAPGDAVMTRLVQPRGHTRLPRYARGKRGLVHGFLGVYVLPDTHAHGLGEAPQSLYSIRFEGGELWGESAEARTRVYLDLWESYLRPAGEA